MQRQGALAAGSAYGDSGISISICGLLDIVSGAGVAIRRGSIRS